MGRHQVSIITDWTLPRASVHMSVHVPPPPPPTISYLHAECPVMLAHLPGLASHKFTSNIFHQGHQIAKDGHDCGKGIPHLTHPPNSILLPYHTIFSKRKIVFGASTVRINGSQTGLIDCSGGCLMLICADPLSLPVEWAPTNVSNTVYVGSTAGDIVGGWAGIVTNAVIELIIFKVAGMTAHSLTKGMDKAIEHVVEYITKQHLKWLLPTDKPGKSVKDLVRKLVDGESSVPTTTPTNVPSVIPTKSPFGDATIMLTSNDDGSFNAETSSPTSGGGRTQQRSGGLGLFGPADDERQRRPTELDALFRDARVL